MKTLLTAMMCSGMLLAAGAASADEMSKDATARQGQMMRDCMAKHEGSMGKDAAMKACREKMQKDPMNKDEMGKDDTSHDDADKPK